MTARDWLHDEDVRGRVETIALSLSMVGVGAGLGIMWSYAAVTQTAAQSPAPWIGNLVAQLRSFIWVATGLFGVGSAVMFALIFTDEDYRADSDAKVAESDEQEVRADGGVADGGSSGSNPWGDAGETTLRDRLRDR